MTERSSPVSVGLLPCPFCTSEDVHECFGVGGTYLVSCASCEGQGPRATNEETAKSAWNTRTLPPSSAATASPSFKDIERLIVEFFNASGANVEFEDAEWHAQFDDPISLTSLAAEVAKLRPLYGDVAQPVREAQEKEITRLATIEECAQVCEGYEWTRHATHHSRTKSCAIAIRALARPSTEAPA